MKIHPPSLLLGAGATAALFTLRNHLRPVVVEIGAIGVELARAARAIVARELENWEDIRAEIEENVRHRARRARGTEPNGAPASNGRVAPNGGPR